MQTTAEPPVVSLEMLAPDQFQQACIVLGVDVVPQGTGRAEMAFEAGQEQALDRVRDCIARACGQPIESEIVRVSFLRIQLALQEQAMTHDAFCARLPDGSPLVIARTQALQRHGAAALARHAHIAQAQRALSQGGYVHEECLREYGLSANAQRQRDFAAAS